MRPYRRESVPYGRVLDKFVDDATLDIIDEIEAARQKADRIKEEEKTD